MNEYWLHLNTPPLSPKTNWNVIDKKETELIYVPYNCILHFTWSCISPASICTNYPDCFSNELHPITKYVNTRSFNI